MNIRKSEVLNGYNLSQQDLLMYLSQVVLCKIDEGTKKEHEMLENNKEQIRTFKERITKKKSRVSEVSSELSRQKALSRVLETLEILEREGLWVGQNGKNLSKILEKVEDMSFQRLDELTERLGVYLPSNLYKRSFLNE